MRNPMEQSLGLWLHEGGHEGGTMAVIFTSAVAASGTPKCSGSTTRVAAPSASAASWARRPKQAARIFAKVLGHVETRGAVEVSHVLDSALARSEPLLLALAPPAPAVALVADDALPRSLRSIDVAAGRAADYDMLLGRGDT